LQSARHAGGKSGDRRPGIAIRQSFDDAVSVMGLAQQPRERHLADARQRAGPTA